jgi:hypothetical protein
MMLIYVNITFFILTTVNCNLFRFSPCKFKIDYTSAPPATSRVAPPNPPSTHHTLSTVISRKARLVALLLLFIFQIVVM